MISCRHFQSHLTLVALLFFFLPSTRAETGGITHLEPKPWENLSSIPSPTYHEVMRYAPLFNGVPWRHLQSGAPHSDAHETMHGYFNLYRKNGLQLFYLGNSLGLYVPKAPGTKTLMLPLLPDRLVELTSASHSDASPVQESSAAYLTYFAPGAPGASGRRADISHVFEEWLCYITEARVGIELIRAGVSPLVDNRITDSTAFFYYGAVAAYTLSQKYPHYFKEPLFQQIFVRLAQATMKNHWEGMVLPMGGKRTSTALLKHLFQSPESASLRIFLRNWLGIAWEDIRRGF